MISVLLPIILKLKKILYVLVANFSRDDSSLIFLRETWLVVNFSLDDSTLIFLRETWLLTNFSLDDFHRDTWQLFPHLDRITLTSQIILVFTVPIIPESWPASQLFQKSWPACQLFQNLDQHVNYSRILTSVSIIPESWPACQLFQNLNQHVNYSRILTKMSIIPES